MFLEYFQKWCFITLMNILFSLIEFQNRIYLLSLMNSFSNSQIVYYHCWMRSSYILYHCLIISLLYIHHLILLQMTVINQLCMLSSLILLITVISFLFLLLEVTAFFWVLLKITQSHLYHFSESYTYYHSRLFMTNSYVYSYWTELSK